MNRQDIEKLLGGYATGTLTPEEEQALFAAALEDQQLFDELARDQSLRDLLRDPAARASLLATLDEPSVPWYRKWQPRLATLVAAMLVVSLVAVVWQGRRHTPQPVLTSRVSAPPNLETQATPNVPSPAEQAVRAPVPRKPASNFRHLPPGRLLPPPKKEPAVIASLVKPAPLNVIAPPPKDMAAPASQPKAAAANEPIQIAPAMAPPPVSSVTGFLPATNQAQTTEVSQLQARSAASARSLGSLVAPLKWTVLHRQPDGEFAAADPADLHAGDTIKLRLESQAAGYVYVSERQALLASSPIETSKPFEIEIPPQGTGDRQIEFWFSSRPVVFSVSAGVRAGGGGANAALAALPRAPSTRITLRYK